MSSLNAGSTNTTLESDWNVGCTITIHQWGMTIKDPEQVVLESQPYQRLSYIWHTFTPDWREIARERVGFTEESLNRIAAERRSKATFEIADLGELVKLTVTHDGFDEDSEVLTTISEGWPHLLSSLKTLLETGETLPTVLERAAGFEEATESTDAVERRSRHHR